MNPLIKYLLEKAAGVENLDETLGEALRLTTRDLLAFGAGWALLAVGAAMLVRG